MDQVKTITRFVRWHPGLPYNTRGVPACRLLPLREASGGAMGCQPAFGARASPNLFDQPQRPDRLNVLRFFLLSIAVRCPDALTSRGVVALATCAALAGLLTGTVAHAADGIGLKLQPELMNPANRAGEVVPAFGVADRIVGRTDDNVELQGHAQLRKGGGVVNADLIRYTNLEDEVFALGSVRIVREGDVYTGPEMRIKMDVRTGYFLEPTYERARGAARGKAARIDFLGPELTRFTDSTYTTCAPDNVDWYVKAGSMTIDEATQSGSGRDVVVYFKGVPILASPFLSFPLSNERKSGFLPPTLSLTSRSGPEVMVPYYWNIAPNRDLTVYPKYIGLRGLQLGGSFRYLEPTYLGTLRAEYLPGDKQAGISRYSVASQHSWNSGTWSGNWDMNKVSDDNYFVDFSRTIAAASQRALPRLGSLTYAAPSGFWSVTGLVLRYQTLQDALNPITRPYEKLPQLNFHGERRDLNGFDVVVDADATNFFHPSIVNGTRMVFYPKLSYPLLAPGYFLTPKISLHATHYNLSNVALGTPNTLTRVLPIGSIEAGMVFERDTTLFGSALRQTLEPRLFYVRTPYINQSQYPNFDSGLTDLSFAQMFSENVYGGSDRIADANQITAALVTRFLNADNGAERGRLAIGQRFYLSEQQLAATSGLPANQRASDFLATVSAEVSPTLTAEMGVQYSQQVAAVVRATTGARWRPDTGKVVNVSYRYLRDSLSQADVSGQWPIGGGWQGVGRVNYSMRDKRLIETLGGVEYEACCWKVRLYAQRFATATARATTTLFVQLELKGLSRIGSNPLDAIRRNVPGYQGNNPNLPVLSPFENYE
jgi:LPS-assembly protein